MAGDFQIVGPLFEIIDATTQTFVTDISSRVLMEITPVVSVGLTLSFIAYGMLVMRGAIDMPVADFLTRSLRIGIIVSIALAGGLYQSQIADAIMATPDALAQAITGNPTGISAANIIDNAAEEGGQYVNKAYEKAGFFSSEGITYTVIGTISLFAVAGVVATGALFLVIAKVAIAILVSLGPLFILALLWQPTARFFELWAGQVLNYALTIVLFSVVFTLIMQLFGRYMAQADLDGVQSVGYTLLGMAVVAIVSVGILLQLPNIASGLAGGIGISYWYELRTMGRAASGAARGARAAGRAAMAAPRAAAGAARGAARMASGAAGVTRAAVGYFRGRKAG
ncbi:type IV secretion system protein [Salmonella enterica subsp. enterica serovar Montevideo]|uniref:type IV secretion system protein n=1 Tax=Escherichia coli TaxID=562 RepID=UPI0012BFBABA|nr:type IV secretion system protein [Escherichia coli]ECZ2303225.1 type IV secretion system protein [Salmonella enterica subsp. enterica serovar Tennessee]ECZ2303471.1 type IV secretion system protein [Salmonella enterica subsp. enterica serovar Tennessee]ELT5580448.1 type IV secretion system protein [Salmonella enterica subsp. enterica serovar Montevideo]NGA89467.1 type IV secretion system protein [Escherichia coli]